jgi:hypothetical protein
VDGLGRAARRQTHVLGLRTADCESRRSTGLWKGIERGVGREGERKGPSGSDVCFFRTPEASGVRSFEYTECTYSGYRRGSLGFVRCPGGLCVVLRPHQVMSIVVGASLMAQTLRPTSMGAEPQSIVAPPGGLTGARRCSLFCSHGGS